MIRCGGGGGTLRSQANARRYLSASWEKTERSALGSESVHLPGAENVQVIRQLASGTPQYPEGAAGLEPPWEATGEVGGVPFCVDYLLQSAGPGSSAPRVRNMGAIVRNG